MPLVVQQPLQEKKFRHWDIYNDIMLNHLPCWPFSGFTYFTYYQLIISNQDAANSLKSAKKGFKRFPLRNAPCLEAAALRVKALYEKFDQSLDGSANGQVISSLSMSTF